MRDIRCFDLIHLENFDRTWHYHHLSKKDPPRNLRVTPGFGTVEDPTAPPATAGTCEAAACLFRVEMGHGGSNLPSWQILQIFRKSNELILILINCKAFPCFSSHSKVTMTSTKIARPACGADPAGCPEGWGAGCGAGVAGPGTSGASKTWFSPSISTSNCSPDWA